MDRGHYSLGIEHVSGESTGICFLAAGYIKTKVTMRTEPKCPS